MQGLTKRRAIAELGIGRDGGDLDTRGTHLLQELQRLPPLLLKSEAGGDAGAIALRGGEPRLGHVQQRAHEPRLDARPQRGGHRHLAIADLAEGARALALHTDRRAPLFGEAGAIEHEDAGPGRTRGAQLPPQRGRVPRRFGDEVLEPLVGAGVAKPRPHRRHRLAATVAQHALNVAPQAAPLRAMRERRLEVLEPGRQTREPSGRLHGRHRASAYRKRRESTMSSKVITVRRGRIPQESRTAS